MRKQVAFAGSINKIEQHKDASISLPVYAMRLVVAFSILHVTVSALCIVSISAIGYYQLWREVVAGMMLLWSIPVVLLVRFAIVGLQYIVVVNESERIEYRFVRVRGQQLPMNDLHDWLIDIKVTGRTGQKRFRELVLRSGNATSDERYRDMKQILKDAGLVDELGGKAGWAIKGGPDNAANILGLPPLLVPFLGAKHGPAGRQNTARQQVLLQKRCE